MKVKDEVETISGMIKEHGYSGVSHEHLRRGHIPAGQAKYDRDHPMLEQSKSPYKESPTKKGII
jgi:hypothetical protein